MKVTSQKFEVESHERLDLVDLTQKVREFFNGSTVKEGMLYLHSLHTTTAIMINEWQDALVDDLKSFLHDIVDDNDYFWHNDPERSDCVRSNATSHLRSALLSHNVMVPIENGKLVLGQWQSIIFADLDGPQKRSIVAQIIGE
jgi:secondary thiamine-phosphate synthase enzyme